MMKTSIIYTSFALACCLSSAAMSAEISDLPRADMHKDIINGFETRGVLKAKQTTNIAAGMSARILKAPYKPGQKFKSGALLIKFDCEGLHAQKRALSEAETAAKLKHENIKELLLAGAAGELEVTMAGSDVKRANAELGIVQVAIKKCVIYAPYSGIVQEKLASAYDTVAVNTPLLAIIKNGTPEIKLIAPSSWLAWVKPEASFEFTIDETGKAFSAKVLRLGASVDPVSQTIELTARFKKGAPGALAGMSGIAKFTPPITE